MNKKTIVIIIALVVVAFFFGGAFLFNSQSSNSTQMDQQNNQTASGSNATSSDNSQAGSVNSSAADTSASAGQPSNPNALEIDDITVGTGATAAPGMTVTVNYVGTLTNGQKFDASADHGGTFSFVLGAGQVIKGWDEGIQGMKVGGTRKLIIPPSLGYGSQAIGAIPANSTLVFTVDLLKVSQ